MNGGRDRSKRRRGNGASATAPSAPAAAAATTAAAAATIATDLKSRLGSRLESAEVTLALQPTKLQDLLIPKLKELLSLSDTIKQRIETLKKFNKSMTDDNNRPVKSREDPEKDLPHISHCLRRPCPITATDAFKDDPGMKKLTDKAQDDWELYAKIKMAEHDKTIKEMEVDLRRKQLVEKIIDLTSTWTRGLIVAKAFKHGMPAEGTLSKEELCNKAVFDIITSADSSVPLVEHLHLNTHLILASRVKSHLSYDEPNVEFKAADLDVRFVQPIITDLARPIMPLTVGIWLKGAEKDVERAINAAIQAELCPPAITQATANVRSALHAVHADDTNQDNLVLEAARTAARKETTKTLQQIMKSQRKKSLGNVENLMSTPKKNGQDGKRKQKSSTAK